MRVVRASVGAAIAAAGLIVLSAPPALAHEGRKLGTYMFVVGFGDEPAYSGGKNSVQLLLATAADSKPVADLGDTLKVTVEKDGATLPLTIEPNFEVGEFGTPGDYRAWFFPTRTGTYTFHFTGSVKGQRVDASFTSSPTGFGEVENPTGKEFPAKDPSAADLGQRLDRELPRLTGQNATLRADLKSARSVATQGRALGIAGLALAVVALSYGLLARRRTA